MQPCRLIRIRLIVVQIMIVHPMSMFFWLLLFNSFLKRLQHLIIIIIAVVVFVVATIFLAWFANVRFFACFFFLKIMHFLRK